MNGKFRVSGLSERQELFVQWYGTPGSETFGNGTRSYMRAYSLKDAAVAASSASTLLRNTKIQAALQALKAENGSGVGLWSERLPVLQSIMDGTAQTTETRLDRKGRPYTVTRGPTVAEMLKAVEVTCEVEGLFPHHKPREATTGKVLNGLLDKYKTKVNRGAALFPAPEKRAVPVSTGPVSGREAALRALKGIADGAAIVRTR